MRLADKVATMARRGKPLPYLRRVAYLESHRTEVVNIPELADYNPFYDSIEIDFEIYLASQYEAAFGGRITSTYAPGHENTFYVLKSPNSVNGSFWHRTEDGVEHSRGTGLEVNSRHTLLIDKTAMTVDGIAYNYTNGQALLDKPTIIGDFILFARHDNEQASNAFPAAMKLWGFKGWRDGRKVCDLIPVLDLSGRPAMYNEVSGQLFYNQGTGEFGWGEIDAADASAANGGGGITANA